MTVQRHILIVEDDADLRIGLRSALAAEGYHVSRSGSAAEALFAATGGGQRFDVVIADFVLPDGDGRDLCSALRRRGFSAPVMLLSRLSEERDVVRGLDAGANDYVVRPFRLGELMARVRAQLRVRDISDDAELAVGRFRFRPGDRLLIEPDGSRVRLTAKEASVLRYLYRAGAAVSRTELMQQVWGYHANATTHTVETHIYRLRLKLEPEAASMRLLQNESGGYRLYPRGLGAGTTPPPPAPVRQPRAVAVVS